MRRHILLLLCGLAPALATGRARAQVPSAGRWETVSSAHFDITYTPGLAGLARHAAAAAERAHTGLRSYLQQTPDGRIDIVLSDNVDLTNGSATPFPGNRIYLYAKPPADVLELGYLRDWMELVVTHELAHIFHLNVTSRAGRALRSVFGRVPSSWPLFPAVGTPGWAVEGLAVTAESGLTPMGRLHGSYHDMVARTAALEDEIDDIDRLSSSSPLWPGGQRAYVYGSLFLHALQQQHGEAAVRRIVRGSANAIIPPALWFDRVAQRTLGVRFRTAYDEWRTQATARYRALADSLAEQGLTETRSLVAAGGIAWQPRYSPDGRAIAYVHSDRKSTPRLRVIDARTGDERWSQRYDGTAGASWIGNDQLLGAELEFQDRDHLFYDLYRIVSTGRERITRGARLQDVDIAGGGARVVAVENDAGSNRLVRVRLPDGHSEPITGYDADTHWAWPRWSPAGDRIAVARWQAGGRFDVVVLDTLGQVLQQVSEGTGTNGAPAWTPDGRTIVFSSDRSGIANLYAYQLASGTLYQLTNLLTGAFFPDVSPDGRSIAFSAYHQDGFHIETLDFDAAALRVAPVAVTPALPASFSPGIPADTATTPHRRYGAWSSALPRYWLPVLLDTRTGEYFGLSSSGIDLVQRHAWSAWAALDPGNGRSQGGLGYQYLGFPAIARSGVQPSLAFAAQRSWDRTSSPATPGAPYVEEREDLLSAGPALLQRRFRRVVSLAAAGELVRRRRELHDAPTLRLYDPDDALLGLRLRGYLSTARGYPFSISTEQGVSAQLAVRERWDRRPRQATDAQGRLLRFDGSYREATGWSALYLPLGRAGFANRVLALRASALWRDGPGAPLHGAGGSSGGSLDLGGLAGAGGSEFLPVRGFPADTREGTRGWSATAELRLPLALISRKPRPLPLFLDRLSAAAFIDAGDADCPADVACDARWLGPTLVGAGGEARLHVSFLGAPILLRLGAASPLAGGEGHSPRGYLQFGSDF